MALRVSLPAVLQFPLQWNFETCEKVGKMYHCALGLQ